MLRIAPLKRRSTRGHRCLTGWRTRASKISLCGQPTGNRDAIRSHIGYYVLSIDFLHPEIGLATEPQTAFFSYSRDDSEFALRLAGDLKAAGANVWLDQLDIAPGQRWARAVQDALNSCQRLLVILSPSSVNSTNVEDEVAFALEEHKTVIPVFYRDCKVPFQLRPFHYVDFRTDYEHGLKILLKTLRVEQQAVASGGAAVSVVPKVTGAHVSHAEESERAAEPARQGKQERAHKAADRPQKAGLEPAVPEDGYLDPETRLMWTTQDNGENIDWDQASKYAEQLRLGGYSDWRLPMIDELEKLYDPQNSKEYKIRIPFRLTAYWVWSSKLNGSGSAWVFSFSFGKRGVYPMSSFSSVRALCVRRSGQ